MDQEGEYSYIRQTEYMRLQGGRKFGKTFESLSLLEEPQKLATIYRGKKLRWRKNY